jgi:hypothetical protein
MTRRILVAIVLLAMIVTASASLVAHEKFKIVGTIVKVHADQLDVKAIDGATYEIDMNESTPVMRGLKKVPRSELRAGQQVVVDALGHDMFDLEAVLIQLKD